MLKKIIIVGAFHEIVELSELCDKEIVGIIDNNKSDKFMSYNILGTDEDAEQIFKNNRGIPLILTPDMPSLRRDLFKYYMNIGFQFTNLISPDATISKSAKIGEGNVIQSCVNISSKVILGKFVKLNSMSNVMHDVIVGDFSTIAPNAVILGKVNIGKLSYIGSNSTILPEKNIGSGAIIGAGAVITKDVVKNTVVVGNPARFLKKNEIK